MEQVALLFGTKHHIYARYGGHCLRLKLGIASGYYHKGTGMLGHQTMNGLTALLVGHFGDRAGIDDTEVSLLTPTCRTHPCLTQ